MATEQLQSTEHDQRVDYIELAVTSVPDAKRFYGAVFGWRFEDYGPDYASFADGRLNGGFAKTDMPGPRASISQRARSKRARNDAWFRWPKASHSSG